MTISIIILIVYSVVSTLIFADVIKTKNEYIDKLKERIDRLESRAQQAYEPRDIATITSARNIEEPKFQFDLPKKPVRKKAVKKKKKK